LLNVFKDKGVPNSEVGMRKGERKKVRSWEGGKLR